MSNPVEQNSNISNAVRSWLFAGVIMIVVQVSIGGITRLTGSGLSITKWEIVLGTLPPMNAIAWEQAFNLYKATPQYQKINQGMSMSDFKFIYFWEYFHRLWARSLGFVFLIPFLWFWRTNQIPRWLMTRLGLTVLLGALVASFGWIMVASGLTNRPWVNAYKLTLHLSLALVLYSYHLWTCYLALPKIVTNIKNRLLWKKWTMVILVVACVQIVLGGIMSGMKASLMYPTWPAMEGGFIPSILLEKAAWNYQNFVEYDKQPFMSGLVQFVHRNVAYLLTIIVITYLWKSRVLLASRLFYRTHIALFVLLFTQVLLGILTLLYSIGSIPVFFGVAHQFVAVMLLSVIWYLFYQVRNVQNEGTN